MSRLHRRIPLICAGVLLTPALVEAQAQPGLALEVNRYFSDHQTLVEGAIEVPYSLLVFHPEGDHLEARAKIEVMIDKADGGEVYHVEREIHPQAVNEAMAGSARVSTIETFAIYAPPGDYLARARVSDLTDPGKRYEMSTPLAVPVERPFFSDILLSNHVQKNVTFEEGSYLPYLIGSTMFNPNPRSLFYKDAPLLYFYYEIDPQALESAQDVELRMVIEDGEGQLVKDLGPRTIKIGEGRQFDLGAFSVGGLSPGRYTLRLSCSDCLASDRRRSFEVRPPLEQLAFNAPSGSPEGASTSGTSLKYYANLSPAQVDSVVNLMDVWFTQQQRQLLTTLNTTGKVQFLNRFWEGLDADPSIGDPATVENEPKTLFEQRVAYANQFFGSLQRLGYDTDRGRIYMLFGEATERIQRPVEATVGPYEIWSYSNTGHTFAFGDFNKDGTYRLIYSTDPNFPGDPTIQSLVDTDASTSMPSFLRTSRGYEQVILDIRQYRTRTQQF